ncbi:MAG: YeeE/YedE thiosulfate transporter family protein, partial [Methyloligellaceae bacterium]
FDGRREMRRHLLGAFLMGFGGVFALGCTVGQGMTGISTLSIGSPLALLGIFIGASFGIHYLVSENLSEAAHSFFGTQSQNSEGARNAVD